MASPRKSLLNPLMKHRSRLDETPMRQLFAEDRDRFQKFSAKAGELLLDYSKNRIDEEAMAALFELARAAGVEERRDAMWRGEHINVTEDRAVGHMALRYMGDQPVTIDGKDVMPEVREVLARMKAFSDAGPRRLDQGRDGRGLHRCREHRHRRLRPRPGHGDAGARALYPA